MKAVVHSTTGLDLVSRSGLALTIATFYDSAKFVILPMGFCFPGLNSAGGDLAPRRECVELWLSTLLAQLPNLKLLF